MAVPGAQCYGLSALHRMYMQDPKGREDVVLRIHLAWWHYHQAVGPLKRVLISGSSGNLCRLQEGTKGGRGDLKKKKGVRKEGSRKWEEGKESRMIFKIGRWNNYY